MDEISEAGEYEMQLRAPQASSAATLPPDPDDYSTSLSQVRDAVREACAGQTEWQGRIAAGIRAALEFAAADPAAARALTAAAHSPEPGVEDRYLEGIECFSSLLSEAVPHPKRFPVSTDEALIAAIATVVGAHAQAATTDRLLCSASDLICMTLQPYAGYEDARRWAEMPL